MNVAKKHQRRVQKMLDNMPEPIRAVFDPTPSPSFAIDLAQKTLAEAPALAFSRERLEKDLLCPECRGLGRGKRGDCRVCCGRGDRENGPGRLRHPRSAFGNGFQSAIGEARRGAPRRVVCQGDHSAAQVSAAASWWYAAGYRLGLVAFLRGDSADSTNNEWLRLIGEAR